MPAAGSSGHANSAVRRQRLDARRYGYVERTGVTTDGVRLAVRDYGSAGARDHTVVLLHGLCLTQPSWSPQVRHLLRRWGNSVRIITYDLLASRATEMVFGLVHRMPRRATDQALNGMVRPVWEGLNKYAGAERSPAAIVTAPDIHTISLTTAVGFLPSLKRYDQYRSLASISANTIVISGGKDIAAPADHAHDLVAGIPGASHLHRPTAGHMLLQEDAQCVSYAIDSVMGMAPSQRAS